MPASQAASKWQCESNTREDWDCSVDESVSADPRLDQGLDWSQCSPKQGFTQPALPRPEMGTTEIHADAAELYRTENKAVFSGNVEIISDSERIGANHAVYDRLQETIDAENRVFFEQKGLRLAATRASYNLKDKRGSAEQVEYRLISRAARGTAESLQIENNTTAQLSGISYTTCAPGNEDWQLKARDMTIDQDAGQGSARNVTLSFKGVPIFYTPYASFPIDDRRKSGFLIPKIGASSNSGLDLSVPYYFNLAPNYDATLTPRIMSKRGLMLGTELRYLEDEHRAQLQAEWLPNDREHNVEDESGRGAAKLLAQGRPWHRWRYDINLNYISDNDYLDDLGESLAATSVKHIERRGDLHYQGQDWNLLGRLQKFQTIDESIAAVNRPYSRLPQVLFNLNKPNQAFGLNYQLRSEYVYFGKDDTVHGSRIDILPSASLPLRRSWGYLTPKLSARHTAYDLQEQLAGYDDEPTRTTTTFSLDSGLFYERDANWFGNAITQTLEPRLFYLYTTREDQQELPDFDSAELDFSFANLFRENRFSGADRVGDANQLTAALSTRSLSNRTGEELFRASLGQIIYFADREIQLTGDTPADKSSSAIVAEVAAKLSSHWKGRAGIQWNPHNKQQQREKSGIALQYQDREQRILNLAYRHTDGLLEQTDISARWPITSRLHGVARWNYSLLHNQTLESFAGIEYQSCCWTTRLITRQHRTAANDDLVSSLFLQLELKGLTSIGDRIDRFLERGILGYDAD